MPEQPTERFTSRVGDYAASRPSYPGRAIDAVLDGLGDPGSIIAADVGAGTGISTRLLLERGVGVIALEPNEAMRRRGETDTSTWQRSRDGAARVRWTGGTGEATGLADRSVDLVLCAQSFHWLDAPVALREFARVLRRTPSGSGGRVAMLWNVHDVRDPVMAAYRELVMRHASDPPRSPWFRNDDCALGAEAGRAAGFGGYRLIEVSNVQEVDRAGLMGRAFSSSYMPASGAARAAAERDLSLLFDRFARGGLLSLRYVCEVHVAELV